MQNSIYQYCLQLADDNLIMGQRISEWCGHGPYLEEDIAITNIALDYLGQANHFYQLAASQCPDKKNADQLAFLRYEHQYLNAQLCEMPNGDYAQTVFKVYLMAQYQKQLYTELSKSKNENLSALAQKSLKEVHYHLTHAKTWLQIFANGTTESREKIDDAILLLWEYSGGLFDATEEQEQLVAAQIVPCPKMLFTAFQQAVQQDFEAFSLAMPQDQFMQKGSRKGIHTEYMGVILCELQYMQRAYPNCTW